MQIRQSPLIVPGKLTELQGVSYEAAWRWIRKDAIPFEQTATSGILVKTAKEALHHALQHVWVSGTHQKGDLDRRTVRPVEYARAQDWAMDRTVRDTGSDLNGRWPRLMRPLVDAIGQHRQVNRLKQLISPAPHTLPPMLCMTWT